MQQPTTLTRCCWNGSVGNVAIRQQYGGKGVVGLEGGLRSGRGAAGPPLSRRVLLQNFNRHLISRSLKQFEPSYATALVSASDRILDTLARSFKHHIDGVPAEDIHIVFIQIPESQRPGLALHSAQRLAEELELDQPYRFHHEFLFEWAVPEECVVHSVTLETLLKRGLCLENFMLHGQLQSTRELGQAMAEDILRDADPWDVGLQLGFLARHFGANAPTDWIAKQIFWDMINTVQYISGEPEFVRVQYRDGRVDYLDGLFFAHMEDGIETCLVHWWLLDEEFLLAIEEFLDWRDMLLDGQNDLYLAWEGKHSHPDYAKDKKRLDEREMRLMSSIESRSIEVGL